jgi:hypothetical protein
MDKELKKVLKETAVVSTAHFVPKIFRKNHLLVRLFWIVLALTSICACLYFIYRALSDYYSFDVVTKIRVITERNPEFPTVTFCNLDPFVTEAAEEIYNGTSLQKVSIKTNLFGLNDLAYLNIEQTMNGILNNSTDKKKKSLGLASNQMIYNCAYNLDDCLASNELVWFFDSNHGNCVKFNSGRDINGSEIKKKRVLNQGNYFGLKLYAFIGYEKNRKPLTGINHAYGN